MTVRACVTVRHKALYMKHNNNTQTNLIMHYISHSTPPPPLHPHTYTQSRNPSLPLFSLPAPPKKKHTHTHTQTHYHTTSVYVCQSGYMQRERREAESALYNINYHAPPSVPQAGEEFCAHALGSCRTPHWVRLQWC